MFAQLFAITLPVFLAIDMVWLGFVAKGLYAKELGFLMKPDVNWTAAILFYLLFVCGLIVFVITPSLETNSIGKAIFLGALFGLVSYATYDLTNLATVANWPVLITVIDLFWGTILSASVSLISFLIARKFGI